MGKVGRVPGLAQEVPTGAYWRKKYIWTGKCQFYQKSTTLALPWKRFASHWPVQNSKPSRIHAREIMKHTQARTRKEDRGWASVRDMEAHTLRSHKQLETTARERGKTTHACSAVRSAPSARRRHLAAPSFQISHKSLQQRWYPWVGIIYQTVVKPASVGYSDHCSIHRTTN